MAQLTHSDLCDLAWSELSPTYLRAAIAEIDVYFDVDSRDQSSTVGLILPDQVIV